MTKCCTDWLENRKKDYFLYRGRSASTLKDPIYFEIPPKPPKQRTQNKNTSLYHFELKKQKSKVAACDSSSKAFSFNFISVCVCGGGAYLTRPRNTKEKVERLL